MLLFYIRHGDPIYHPDSLTPLSERQAESVAKRLALFGIDEIYTSSSIRAKQTSRPTCELLGKTATELDWMHENLAFAEMAVPIDEKRRTWIWNHPKYAQMLTAREVRSMGDLWYTHPELKDYHFERSIERLRPEIDALMASFGLVHDRELGLYAVPKAIGDKRIAIFAHEGFGKLLMSELLDIPLPYYAAHFEMKHTGMTVIAFEQKPDASHPDHARARVLTVSNDSHLYRDGLPLVHASTMLRERY